MFNIVLFILLVDICPNVCYKRASKAVRYLFYRKYVQVCGHSIDFSFFALFNSFVIVMHRQALRLGSLCKPSNSNNNNNLIYKAPYGHNFRGTVGIADKFSCM